MAQAPSITIVGAGLVGSLLAVMLAKRGRRVTIYEKRPDLRTADISTGRSINLALAERGIRPLTDAGLFDDVRKLLIPMRGRMLHSKEGQQEFFPYGQRPHEVIYSVSRADLNGLMMSAAERTGLVDVVFNTSCQEIDFVNRTMSLHNEHSGAAKEVGFDVLIGADGAGSLVRQMMLAQQGGSCSVDFLDHHYKELTMPASADGGHQLEKEALHIWPRGGFMLIALPNLDGSYTVTLFLNASPPADQPTEKSPSFQSLSEPGSVDAFFQREFSSAMELMPNVAEEFAKNPTGRLGTVRCDQWRFDDTALLVGDASHAIVPFHGQGMNAGFEDCSVLMARLDAVNGDWSAAIEQFTTTRPPDTNAIADMALENYTIMRDSVRDPRFQLKKQLGFALERQFPDRFIPRYSMVMFHHLPYSVAQRRGQVQDELLMVLTNGIESIEQVDMAAAGELVKARLEQLADVEPDA